MVQLHPQVIEKDGKKEFVVLPFEEFVQIKEELENYQDLQALRAAKEEEGDASTLSLDEVKTTLGI